MVPDVLDAHRRKYIERGAVGIVLETLVVMPDAKSRRYSAGRQSEAVLLRAVVPLTREQAHIGENVTEPARPDAEVFRNV